MEVGRYDIHGEKRYWIDITLSYSRWQTRFNLSDSNTVDKIKYLVLHLIFPCDDMGKRATLRRCISTKKTALYVQPEEEAECNDTQSKVKYYVNNL